MKTCASQKRAIRFSAFALAGIALFSVVFIGNFRGKNTRADSLSHTETEVLGFDPAKIEQLSPIGLPAAAQYPKPGFDGTVAQVSPAWSAPSILPDGLAHIDPDNPQSPPVRDFTITQCWEGSLHGGAFTLQTFCDFNLSEGNPSDGGSCYIALKTGEKVFVTPVDRLEILVNFCGPMAVFIRNAMSYDALAINLQSGNEVEASGDKMYLLACARPFDPNHSPVLPSHVMGISRQAAVYPVSQTSASTANPFENSENTALWEEAWEHRIGHS